MAAKRDYQIDARTFRVEKDGTGWRGWYLDEPAVIIRANRKQEVLRQAGHERRSGGVVFANSPMFAAANPRAPERTSERLFRSFRDRVRRGEFPKIGEESPLERSTILARDDFKCTYCGTEILSSTDVHIDHIRPIEKGGHDTAANLTTACSRCNLRKSNSLLENEESVLEQVRLRNEARQIAADQLVATGHLSVCLVDRTFGGTDYSWRLLDGSFLNSSAPGPLRVPTTVVFANNRDVILAGPEVTVPDQIPHHSVTAEVDLGTSRVSISEEIMATLEVPVSGECRVVYRGCHGAIRPRVTDLWLQLGGRSTVVSAVVEPLGPVVIGGSVIEELDLLVRANPPFVSPRESSGIICEF